MIKLNLGSGVLPLKGYINIDSRNIEGTDRVYDIRKIKDLYKDNSVDEIAAKDVLEHIGRTEWHETLQDWIDILKPGGVLKLRVPDTLKLFKQFKLREHNKQNFNTLLRLLFGLQDVPEQTHLTGFTKDFLTEDLEEMGMVIANTSYDGGVDLRVVAIKGNAKPLVDLVHPDYLWKELKK